MCTRPHCSLFALLTCVLALGLSSARADDEAIKEKLFQAKKQYDEEMQKFKKAVGDLLDKREDTARKAGNKKAIDQIKAERDAFEKSVELPSMLPATLRDSVTAARTRLDKAYSAAIKEYVRLKMDDAAGAIEKEQQEFLLSSALSFGKRDFINPDNWEGVPGLWKIDGNTIIGETKEDPKYNNFLCSKKKYGDFELTCKVLLKDGIGNSGIQIRSELVDPKKFVVAGPQVDVGLGFFGSLYGERVGGYSLINAGKKDLAKPTDYNEYYILAKGNHITIKMNGEVTLDQDFPENKTAKGKAPVPAQGIIAFQIHGGFPKLYVEFKDIKFTDLSKK